MESRKIVQVNPLVKQKQRYKCREQRFRHQRRKGGWSMNQQIGVDIDTLLCIKWMANENLL